MKKYKIIDNLEVVKDSKILNIHDVYNLLLDELKFNKENLSSSAWTNELKQILNVLGYHLVEVE